MNMKGRDRLTYLDVGGSKMHLKTKSL